MYNCIKHYFVWCCNTFQTISRKVLLFLSILSHVTIQLKESVLLSKHHCFRESILYTDGKQLKHCCLGWKSTEIGHMTAYSIYIKSLENNLFTYLNTLNFFFLSIEYKGYIMRNYMFDNLLKCFTDLSLNTIIFVCPV